MQRSKSASSDALFTIKDKQSLRKTISSRLKLQPNDGISWNALDTSLSSVFTIDSNLNLPTNTTEAISELGIYTSKIGDDIRIAFESIRYLGPLRSSPKRFYSEGIRNYQKGEGKNNLGLEIFHASKKIRDDINNTLEKFNIPYELNVKDLGNINTGPLISVQLTDLRNGAIVTPKDVGFGIGQVLPIIFDGIVSNKKIICVEQPEIHLHPKLQAHLADLFINSVTSGRSCPVTIAAG